jgi:ubiquinone/menaquinone biosynthesis C-methylase UbiE
MTQARRFYGNVSNRGHADRHTDTDPMDRIARGLKDGRWVADSSLALLEGDRLSVLEVGCSWGSLVFSFAASDRVAEVTGVDIEPEALDFARAIADSALTPDNQACKCRFTCCPAERLPFPDNTFDLISCHTVIEHVENVETALNEMMRVLKPGGALHLEAPNYLWPYEPHLQVGMLPLGPKWLVRTMARLRKRDADFVDHLQFVHPFSIERLLRQGGYSYQNIYLEKLARILIRQEYESILGLRRVIPLLRVMHTLRLTRFLYFLTSRTGFYSSIMYRVTK